MKIIGEGRYKFIAEITGEEIRKVLDKSYTEAKPPKVGDEIDIASGYDFRNEIKHLTSDFLAAEKRFSNANKMLTELAIAIAKEGSNE